MKSERVSQLEIILKSHPEGLRKSEIARKIGVHRSTVGRYIDELKNYNDVYEDNNLVKIVAKDEKTDEALSLSVYEVLALKMSAELLMKNAQTQNPHLISALRKIAISMEGYAGKLAHEIIEIADEVEKKSKKQNNDYASILEVLIDAWISGRIVKIFYAQNKTEEEIEVAPYFIGFIEGENGRNPITVTGRLRHTTEIVTIDIIKIKRAVILDETYTIPDNLRAFRKNENPDNVTDVIDTIPLVLNVKRKSALNSFRILAHSEIKVKEQQDGSFTCSFDAENSIELVLRIIQCFDSVEIVSPDKFRTKFVENLRKIISIYE